MDKQLNAQTIYIISVDYGGAWAWLKDGGEINDTHKLGGNIASGDWWGGAEAIPDELIKEFCIWQAQFENTDFFLPEPTAAATFPWATFNQQGLVLCHKLKAILGDRARVCYERAWEETEFSDGSVKEPSVRLEIMADGSAVTWPLSK